MFKVFGLVVFSIVIFSTSNVSARQIVTIQSPDHHIDVKIDSRGGGLQYSIAVDHQLILEPSDLGIRTDNVELGQVTKLGRPNRHYVDESYGFWGAHSLAVNKANEVSIPVISHEQNFWLDVHVANDGVAVRLRLNAQKDRHIEADRSSWKFSGNPAVWAAVLGAAYETPYRTTTLADLSGATYGMPVTLSVHGFYVSITEAGLKDYGDLALHARDDRVLEGSLYADKEGWETDSQVIQPWRVTIVARNLSDLVNTTLVQNLNPPPADPSLATATWIKPGRASWQWLSSGGPVEGEQRQWVDWTQELRFEYCPASA